MASVTLDYQIMNPRAALSVDVEDYFQVAAFSKTVRRGEWDSFPSRVEANTHAILEICREKHARGTFFILGWVAERYPGLVREIREAGHEIGCHGYAHRLIYEMTPEEFREDLKRAKDIIEDAAGIPVRGFRAPTYSIITKSLWALDILIQEGFRFDSSIFPVTHDRYGIPGAPRFPHWIDRGKVGSIQEYPPTTVRLLGRNLPVAGGGYLRLLPFRMFMWAWQYVAEHNQHPLLLYIHPWEVDPEQPHLKCSPLTRWRHYRNLHKTPDRLRFLFEKCSFIPVGEMLWEMQTVLPAYQLTTTPLVPTYTEAAATKPA